MSCQLFPVLWSPTSPVHLKESTLRLFRSNALWAVIGAIVGLFLMPTTWIALALLTVGATAGQTLRDLQGYGDASSPEFDPGIGEGLPPDVTAPAPSDGGLGVPSIWIVLAAVVALIVTVLSSVFFAALGYRLSALDKARRDAARSEAWDRRLSDSTPAEVP
jgi:hypothetical protein